MIIEGQSNVKGMVALSLLYLVTVSFECEVGRGDV